MRATSRMGVRTTIPTMTPVGQRLACVDSSSTSTMPGRSSSNDSDRKSTRLNSSHTVISYAVFCLKKKKKCNQIETVKFEGLEDVSPRREDTLPQQQRLGDRQFMSTPFAENCQCNCKTCVVN